jgi:hypothetical protein
MVDVFSIHDEHGTLKPIQVILRKEGGRRRLLEEEMNQIGVNCTHIWKYHNESLCITNIY